MSTHALELARRPDGATWLLAVQGAVALRMDLEQARDMAAWLQAHLPKAEA